jgi:hypothetical protein
MCFGSALARPNKLADHASDWLPITHCVYERAFNQNMQEQLHERFAPSVYVGVECSFSHARLIEASAHVLAVGSVCVCVELDRVDKLLGSLPTSSTAP